MDRDRLLAAFATLLGVSVEACARQAEPVGVPVAAYEVPSATPISPSPSPSPSPSVSPSPSTPMAAPPPPPGASCASNPAPGGSCASSPTPGKAACGAGTCAGAVVSTIPNAERVVRVLQPRFRACYQKELTSTPNLTGALTLTIEVATDGSVANVTPGPTSLPASLVACLVDVVQNAQFSPPTSGRAHLTVPLRFAKGK